MYFKDSRSLLVVFLDKKQRSSFEPHLPSIIGRPASELVMSPGSGSQDLRAPLRRMGSRMFSGFRADELSTATRKWQARELSNVCLVTVGPAPCSLSLTVTVVCLLEYIESNIWENS